MASYSGARAALRFAWVAVIVLVAVGSLLPSSSAALALVAVVPDKALHFAGYLMLGLLPALHERSRTVALSALFAVGMGILLEFVQAWMAEGRNFEVQDMISNAAGCALGAGLGLGAGSRLGFRGRLWSRDSATGTSRQQSGRDATSRRTPEPGPAPGGAPARMPSGRQPGFRGPRARARRGAAGRT